MDCPEVVDAPVVQVQGASNRLRQGFPTTDGPEVTDVPVVHVPSLLEEGTAHSQASGQVACDPAAAQTPGNFVNHNSLFPKPNQIQSIHCALGHHVSQALGEKIIQRQYVDLAALLPTENLQSMNKANLMVNTIGQLVVGQAAQKKIATIEEWSDAFLIYASIYAGAFPDQIRIYLNICQ